MDSNDEIHFDFTPFFRVYKSGRVERLKGIDVVPASFDPSTGVASKDVVINPTTGVSARLYLPNISASPATNLPILVYYHGGIFVIESTSSPAYHNFLNTLAAQAGVLIVSVDYRRAPEHPLPTAHEDSWAALQWVVSRPEPEGWLAEHGDLERVFLAGDSAGANIAHHMAMRAGAEGLGIEGMALIHPWFLDSEMVAKRPRSESVWRVVCPGTSGPDDPLINPLVAGAAELVGLGCRRVMVSVAEMDFLRGKGVAYYEAVVASGWGGEAELVDTDGEEHVFYLGKPTCEKAVDFIDRLVAFLKHEKSC